MTGIRGAGAMAAVHCCGSIDIDAICATGPDHVSIGSAATFDESAFSDPLRRFVRDGGGIAFGAGVPPTRRSGCRAVTWS